MPLSPSDYNTYRSPIGRAQALASNAEALKAAEQSREFDAELQPYRMEQLQQQTELQRLQGMSQEQKLEQLAQKMRHTDMAVNVNALAASPQETWTPMLADFASRTQDPTLKAFYSNMMTIPPEQQAKAVGNMASFASQLAGVSADVPSSVREWQYFNALPPEAQRRYLTMKRSPGFSIQDVGGGKSVFSSGFGMGEEVSSRRNENEAAASRAAEVAAAQVRAERGAGRLPSQVEDVRAETFRSSIESGMAAGEYGRIAAQLDANPEMLSGFAGGAAQWIKDFFGTQDADSALRTEVARLTNKIVIGSLPPGVASDRDIAIAYKGALDQFGDPEVVASWFWGQAKINAFVEAQNAFITEYIKREQDYGGAIAAAKEYLQTAKIKSGKTAYSDADGSPIYELIDGSWVDEGMNVVFDRNFNPTTDGRD